MESNDSELVGFCTQNSNRINNTFFQYRDKYKNLDLIEDKYCFSCQPRCWARSWWDKFQKISWFIDEEKKLIRQKKEAYLKFKPQKVH